MNLWRVAETTERMERSRRIAEAARLLDEGRLVVLPTETVYGLAADASNGAAVAAIYSAKARPQFNPLIAHVADREMAEQHGLLNEMAARVVERFWPGPLTLVVPKSPASSVSELVTAGLATLALRLPSSDVTQAVIRQLGRPVAAPSANRSGRISTTTADAALADLNKHVAMAIDTGPSRIGVESTIIACIGEAPVLLRPGGVPREEIEALIGPLAQPMMQGDAPPAPGMLASHYAPGAPVRLNARSVAPDEAVLAFGQELPEGWQSARAVLNLSPDRDLAEAAANLFAYLRQLDASGASTIAVMPVPGVGLGEAINDRLSRAAAPRHKETGI